jgi:hypothetical protein
MNNTTNSADILNSIKNMDENFATYIIMFFVIIGILIIGGFIFYYKDYLQNADCNLMNNLYPSKDGYIIPISSSDQDCSGSLYDYYIKTAYNSCSGGSYTNDYVDICSLKSILKQGVRGLDFEIYSIDNEPVVATSISDNYYVKQTFNSVKFADVMNTIQNYAFSDGTAPNYTDPLIIHLRCMSTNQEMYNNLASLFASYDSIMLGKEYSFENQGKNLGQVPLTDLKNKCVLIVEKINNAFLENESFLEYINLVSNSIFMRAFNYTDVANNHDVTELTNYNRRGLTIVFPDNKTNPSNPSNPSGILCREYGCQMVAMRYQKVDNFLEENKLFFDRSRYAFSLKPQRLRYTPVVIPEPEKQKEAYNYATKNISTDYYSFNY